MKPTVSLALLLLVPHAARPQDLPARAFATLEAVVVDSLRAGLASRASVMVVGTTRFGFADSSGRVRIDSVPPGTHLVELSYDGLDTIGLRIRTPPLSFHGGAVVDLTLGIPSAQTILRAKCGNARLGSALIGTATLFLAIRDSATAAAVAGAPVRSATVRGVVVDSAGRPLRGVRVGLKSTAETTVTDSAGAFSLSGQQSGTQVLVSRRIGYQPAVTVVTLSRRAPREVVVRLNAFVPVLEAVYVEARRNAALDRTGFTDRQRSGQGTYLSQADLDRRHAMVVSDFLRYLPSVRASGRSDQRCTTYWVDGMHWPGDADDEVAAAEVAAIEVYSGISS